MEMSPTFTLFTFVTFMPLNQAPSTERTHDTGVRKHAALCWSGLQVRPAHLRRVLVSVYKVLVLTIQTAKQSMRADPKCR